MVWTCKQVAKTLAEHNYQDLSWYQKATLIFHVKICAVCGKYHTQVMDFQDGTRRFLEQEERVEEEQGASVSADTRQRWRQALEEAGGPSS